MLFNTKTYDALKSLAQIWLPALATLYFTLAQIWHLPAAEEIVGTIAAIDTFLGLVLKVSSTNYEKSDAKYDGILSVEHDGEGTQNLRLTAVDYDALNEKDQILFKVVDRHTPPQG